MPAKMNPFEVKTKPADRYYMDWQKLYPRPYDKNEVDPYTRLRIILMNGTEYEANWFSHQFHRHCTNNDLRRELAVLRRTEQQQQKRIACLKPIDESILETTIGYEQLAVDLTAILAQREPDAYVVQVMNLALLEDFDHLYRYADLLELERGIHAELLVLGRKPDQQRRGGEHGKAGKEQQKVLLFVRQRIQCGQRGHGGPHHQAERRHYHRRRTADDELLYEHRHLL